MTDISSQKVITSPLLKPLSTFPIIVLLIDDQEIIAHKIRHMLSEEEDITFHYCSEASHALEKAIEINPTVILQDLVMPDINGMELTRYFRAHPKTKEIPLIVLSSTEDPAVKAEAFSLGANDYVVKLPDKLELIARIRYHSNGYIRLLERNEAYEKLRESQRILNEELSEAAEYVRSLLPAFLTGPIQTRWDFIPSEKLGGDAFGYHWLDEEHFAIFLLDVCGHGVGAALLSSSVINVLRSQTLPQTDFRNPVEVMQSLNHAFPMEAHNNMFFTLWYGVWHASSRVLSYSTAGHPPALLLLPDHESKLLRTEGLVIGADQNATFLKDACSVPPNSQLYIFSDGVYEITKSDGTMVHLDDLIHLLSQPHQKPASVLENCRLALQAINIQPEFSDDYSLVQMIF